MQALAHGPIVADYRRPKVAGNRRASGQIKGGGYATAIGPDGCRTEAGSSVE
jgi:hypothetical protein